MNNIIFNHFQTKTTQINTKTTKSKLLIKSPKFGQQDFPTQPSQSTSFYQNPTIKHQNHHDSINFQPSNITTKALNTTLHQDSSIKLKKTHAYLQNEDL